MLVGVVATVVVAAITATVESVELVALPHDARPAMRSVARSLFMPLVYTTFMVTVLVARTFFLELRTVRVSLHVVLRDGVRRFLPLIVHPPVTLYVFVPVLESEISEVSDFCVLRRTVFAAVVVFGACVTGDASVVVATFFDLKMIVGFGAE